MFGVDLCVALGSGMTVKFFPLFFKNDCGLSPSQVQTIYFFVPLAMLLCGVIVQKISRTFGRIQSILLVRCSGITCLLMMVFFKTFLISRPYYIIPLYILRTALMNSTYPLEESLFMDFVPKDARARWKSLSSITSFGWCGSALLGGYLSDKYDYTHTFLFTAMLQGCSTLTLVFLIPLVPRKEEDVKQSKGASKDRPMKRRKSAESLTAPLLESGTNEQEQGGWYDDADDNKEANMRRRSSHYLVDNSGLIAQADGESTGEHDIADG